jgi:ABC-type multidrug transport system fused ATPase/permease subunit
VALHGLYGGTKPVTILIRIELTQPLLVQNATLAFGTLIFIAVTNPYMILAIAPVTITVIIVTRYFTRCAVEFSRFEAAKRSPIFSHLTNTINGLAVIRCHQGEQAFISTMDTLLDEYAIAVLMNASVSRWFGMVIFLLTNCFLAVVVISSLYLRTSLSIGAIALSIVYSVAITVVLRFITFKVCLVDFALLASDYSFSACPCSLWSYRMRW